MQRPDASLRFLTFSLQALNQGLRTSDRTRSSSLVGMEPWSLQDREATVRAEVSVERDRLPDAQPFHDDETQGVPERVRLVLVGAQEGDGPLLVVFPNRVVHPPPPPCPPNPCCS